MGATQISELELVSIIIPCYNQAPFLGEALESACGQTYPRLEILVVDDGSTDETPEVVRRLPSVRYIRESNQGLSAARNTGLAYSTGRYLVFLDADDRLVPHAVEVGLAALAAHPECACVAGHYRLISAEGALLRQWPRAPVDDDAYAALLRRNHIGMHATVLYRRAIFEEVGGFDRSVRACEDYDLLLRIARRYPIYCHDTVVAEYRQHEANMSRDPALMLKAALTVHRRQWRIARQNPRHVEAYEEGRRFWQEFYGGQLVEELRTSLYMPGRTWSVLRGLVVLRALCPQGFRALYPEAARELWGPSILYRRAARRLRRIGRRILPAPVVDWIRARRRGTSRRSKSGVSFGNLRRVTPISETFGFDRGQPIDRFYIEQFLARHADDVRGHVLEFGDNAYTRAFGGSRVTRSDVLHVREGNPHATIVADLMRADHIPSDEFDCIICTQTLHLIYDLRAAVGTLHRILKPAGVVLATVPGISHISQDEWRDQWCWSLTMLSARRLFEERFQPECVAIDSHGNVLAATAFLYGLAADELREDELAHRDPHYQVLIAIRAQKPGLH